jgi:hypothetical protein
MRLSSGSWSATTVALVLTLTAGWIGVPGVATAAAGTATAWGPAQPVPIDASVGTFPLVNAISCPKPGNCTAGGYYSTATRAQGFVVDQTDGVWGKAQPVPGLAALNAGQLASVDSVSCVSPGNCAAGGIYSAANPGSGIPDIFRGFVVSETNGTWSTVDALPPPVPATRLGEARIRSVSCTAPGDCLAGGFDTTDYQTTEAFVVQETNGAWGTPVQLPGAAPLAQVASVSCAAPGECVAGMGNANVKGTAALATESGGAWSAAEPVPGLAGLASDQEAAMVYSVSCPSEGDCTAAGVLSIPLTDRLFVVDETNGVWGNASELELGSSAATGAHSIDFDQAPLSCGSPGNCVVGGSLMFGGGFVADEVNGRWAISGGPPGDGTVTSVSCASAGNCSAGGYVTGPKAATAFIIDETGGTWGSMNQIADSGALVVDVDALSCASADSCGAAGFGYVVEKGPVTPTATAISLSAGSVAYGHEQAEHVSVTVTAALDVPTGTVAVTSGAVTVCTIVLVSGQGSCAVPATRFGPGAVKLVAEYAGPPWLAASTSAAVSFSVTRAGTRTGLRLSAAKVRYGHEQAEKISVVVTPAFAGLPSGTVTVKAGKVTACAIRLKAAKGSCALTAKQLKPGSYHLIAAYGGSTDFLGSASDKASLTVTK